MRKPVFEVTGDCLCTLVDENSTLEYIGRKLEEKKVPEDKAGELLRSLRTWFTGAKTGQHHPVNAGGFTATVTKAAR